VSSSSWEVSCLKVWLLSAQQSVRVAYFLWFNQSVYTDPPLRWLHSRLQGGLQVKRFTEIFFITQSILKEESRSNTSPHPVESIKSGLSTGDTSFIQLKMFFTVIIF
jgi:hypothetical protein